MPVPFWDEIQKSSKTADLLIQQAKVRRNSFITIQVTFTTNFNYVLCGMIITRLAPRVHVLYYLTDTFVMFVYLWG